MTQAISDRSLDNLSAFLAGQLGLLFPKERWSDLEKGLLAAAGQFGFKDAEQCIGWLLSAPLTRSQVEILAGFFTVGETYFYRDPRTLEILERDILPGILRERRDNDQHLRIWSAGCSTGEEPYSIAILLHRLLPDIKEWNISILATDINPAALAKGVAAVYGKWSLRGAPSWLTPLYFTPVGEGRFRVNDQIRRLVCFEYLNLAKDSYPSLHTKTNAMDIIFCRNVLIYFAPEVVQKVVGKLQRCLLDNGWLIVGPVEYSQSAFAPLEAVDFSGVCCYRKKVPAQYEQPAGEPKAEAVAATPPSTVGQQQAEQRAMAGEPERSTPSYETAEEQYRQGLYTHAAATLWELYGGGVFPAQARALLVRCQANLGKLSEALKLCDEALRVEKLDPALHYLRAEILQEQGLLQDARSSLRRALYLDPKLVLAHFALGNLTLWEGEPGKARKHFANALTLLSSFAPEETLPGSEGMTAGRLGEIIRPMAGSAGDAERTRG